MPEIILTKSITKLIQKQDLSAEEAKSIMLQALEGNLSDITIASWLTASTCKPETSEEIAAYAEVMREKSEKISLDFDIMDTCGTGGDGSNLMNVSTLTGIALASLGIPVAKHGNRSVSSKCGSADILEALGYPLEQTQRKEQTAENIKKNNFGFMFAPHFHPAMKHVGPVRKEMGIRTVFNILGPLCNPAKASVQLMGVFSEELLNVMSEALKNMQIKAALVFHSKDGLDEISPLAETSYKIIQKGQISSGILLPPPASDISIKSLDEIQVTGLEDALKKAETTLNGNFSAGVDILSLNTAAGLFIWEVSQNKTAPNALQEFINSRFQEIKSHIQQGKALAVVNSFKN